MAVFFDEFFDDGSLARMTKAYSGSGAEPVAEDDPAREEYSCKLSCTTEAEGWSDIDTNISGSVLSEVYTRFAIYVPTGHDIQNGEDVYIFQSQDTNWSSVCNLAVVNSNLEVQMISVPGDWDKYDTGLYLTPGVWNEIEFYFKIHATEGVMRVWVNGKMSEATALDNYNASSVITNMQYGIPWAGSGGHSGLYVCIDNIEISTTRIGSLFTRSDESSLPADDLSLNNSYTDAEVTNMGSNNTSYVERDSLQEYALHQYKFDAAGQTSASITWNGKSNVATGTSPVLLQIYNRSTKSWSTIDTESTAGAGTEFDLTATVNPLTNYKDANGMVTCRVYQNWAQP